MTDAEFIATCAIIRGAGEDDKNISLENFRRYFTEMLLNERIARYAAESRFAAWKESQEKQSATSVGQKPRKPKA